MGQDKPRYEYGSIKGFEDIEEAKAILKTDLGKKLTIEEIAERVGYNSKSAFNTAFKKHTGMTPTEYKRNKILS